MTRRPAADRRRSLGFQELLDIYRGGVESGADAAYRKRRWGRTAEFAEWLEQEALAALESRQALALYRACGGRDRAAFAGVPIEELRDSLDFLLYDTIKLEGRFDECASPQGAYRVSGTGKEFVSWLLCVRNPSLLGVWDTKAERLIQEAGVWHDSMKQGPFGIRYLDVLEGLSIIRGRFGLADFIEVDVLAHLSTAAGRRGLREQN